jgi:TonB family protein
MREAVSDIITERSQAVEGVSRMVVLSVLAHAVLLTVLTLKPDFWIGRHEPEPDPMVISLGGAEGPEAGGLNPLSARPVQEVAAPETRPRAEPQPAPKPPEMTVPEPAAKVTPKPSKPVEKPAEKTSSRKPTTGAEVKSGSAVAETGSTAQVPFGGLSTSGGGTGGARVDAPNFCCPSYLSTVVQLIKRNWGQNQGTTGKNTIKFVVQRDGRVTDVEVEESAGQLLDIASRRALVVTNAVPPLPREFAGDKLTIHLVFEYTR